jgi:membrane-bound lytic murein transglycosylase A
VRGLVADHKVIPFYSREQIESDRQLLAGNELVWIDDRDAVFFLHIQGSGRIQLRDGSVIGAGYSDQNGHPYVAIGRLLLERGELDRDEISLFTIRQWLRDNPGEAELLLNQNPSYVFFELREDVGEGPVGSLNVPLTPQRSIAIDPKTVPLGTPVWLQTNIPGAVDLAYNRLVIAQDTGGAIKGPLRADLFWGHGQEAENNAGIMKERGSMLVLLPRPNVE